MVLAYSSSLLKVWIQRWFTREVGKRQSSSPVFGRKDVFINFFMQVFKVDTMNFNL